jgi:hypothetical protein
LIGVEQRGVILLASSFRVPFKELKEKFELETYGTCTGVVTPSKNLGAALVTKEAFIRIPQLLRSVLIIS